MAGMPRPIRYDVSVPAPDLSNIYKLAGRVGTLQGLNDFGEDQLKEQQKNAKLQAQYDLLVANKIASDAQKKKKQEQGAAKDDIAKAGEESVNHQSKLGLAVTGGILGALGFKFGGVFSKAADMQMDATEKVIDVASRLSYGSNNAVKYFNEHDDKKSVWKDLNFGDILEDTGGAAKAWGRGFTGKEKTTFSQVLKERADHDGKKDFRDSKWFQGGVGFVGDVALDPSTYVGVGLIKAPLKSAKAIEQSMAKSRSLMNISEDVAKLGVKNPETETLLTKHEIYGMLGGHAARKGQAAGLGRKAMQAKSAQMITEQLPRLKKWIRDTPEIDTVAGLKHLDDTIAENMAKYESHLDDYSKTAYRDALTKFDSNIEKYGPKMPEAESLLTEADRAVPIARSAKAFQEEFYASTKADHVPNAKFNDSLGEGWKNDKRISPEFRDKAYSTVMETARHDPLHQQYVRQAKIITDNTIKPLESKLRETTKGSVEHNNIKNQLASAKQKRAHAYDNANRVKASLFHNLTQSHLNSMEGMDKSLGNELVDLIAEEAELNERLSHLGQVNKVENIAPAADELDITVRASDDVNADEALVADQTREASSRLKEVQDRILDIQKGGDLLPRTHVDAPVGMPKDFDVSDEWLKQTIDDPEVKSYQQTLRNEVEDRTEKFLASKVETFKRRAREDRVAALVPDRVRSMFGAGKARKNSTLTPEGLREAFKDPYVTINGKKVFKSDTETLANYNIVKPEDVKEAARLSNVADPMISIKKGGVTEITPADIEGFMKAGKLTVNPNHVAFDRVFKEQHGMSLKSAIQAKNNALKDIKSAPPTTKVPTARLKREAYHEAIKSVDKDIKGKSLRARSDAKLEFRYNSEPTLDESYEAAVAQARHEFAVKESELKTQGVHSSEEAQRIQQAVKELRQIRDTKIELHKEAYEEAKRTREAMADKLDEQIILDALHQNTGELGNRLRFTVGGFRMLEVPVPRVMTQATEAMSGLPILQQGHKVWSSAFSPASSLEPELNLARLRAQSRTPDIIKHHVEDIRHNFSQYTPADRTNALISVLKGVPSGDAELYGKMNKYFEDMVPYFSGKVDVGGEILTVGDINRYMPEDLKFISKNKGPVDAMSLRSPKEIVEAMRNLKPRTDPMKIMWQTRIAIEQAMSHKAMQTTITSLYGVKRVIRKGPDAKFIQPSEKELLIEDLHDKHNWETIKDLGDNHYFSPESAVEIRKLLHMMQPQRVHEITKVYDKAMRAWKSTVTVYNPGYYTRNAIGETIMGAFDGLSNPKWYTKASNILKYSMPDDVNEVLKTLEPWKKHATTNQLGKRTVMTLAGGRKLTAEDVWVLYHDSGLKSGFISSEYDHYFPAANNLKATKAGQVANKINDGVREKGEKFEDFFRLAHFMYRMGKSGHRNPAKAAEEAARYVRKYHYDYTDFTPFEKTTMLRVFPFYKWTRKSLPLMASMLFTNPGKVMMYPKAMQNLSYGTGGTPVGTDTNGFAPNYEDLTPEWMKGLMAYPLGRDDRGEMTYMNVATPAFDIYKMGADPTGTTIGMLNPLIKVPTEQALGRTLDPKFDIDLTRPTKSSPHPRFDHLMRTTPQTSLVNNGLKGQGEGDSIFTEPTSQRPNIEGFRMDEKLTSFLSGLGFYENSEKRQKGEQLRRNFEGSK